MKTRNRAVLLITITLIALSFGLSFLYRPRPPINEIVTASQEVPSSAVFTQQASPLSARVTNSFALALVLVKSEFSEKNAIGIEALRVWAQGKFQKDPSFLHPVTLQVPIEVQHSIFDSFLYNLFAGPTYYLQEQVMELLSQRIDAFHQTRPYESFRRDYYEIFGLDSESTFLLARYQAERARSAVNVILGAGFWTLLTISGVVAFLFARHGLRSTRGQKFLAYGWLFTALLYLIIAWTQNEVATLIAALLCGGIGFYLRKPVAIRNDDEKGLSFKITTLSPRAVAIVSWISLSLLAIRVLTWIKTGNLVTPDPITLLASSWSGDFLHDPVHAKRNISRVVGIAWVLFGLWVTQYVSIDRKAYREVEEGLSSLPKRPVEV